TVGGATKGFVLDPLNPTGMYFLDFGASAVYFDDLQDHLYTLSGGNIQRWDADAPLVVTAKSKLFRFPKPTQSFACAQVVANSYPTVAPITFKLYADGVLKHTQTVLNGDSFRLPSGYYAETVQFELTTTNQILYAAVANSMAELAGI
ncbi:MAG: hypothetical protein H7293_18220, partial [Candidatus Saccharibacteria bacterium]|nr:hypothetical protein [Rhodoferax sp.]